MALADVILSARLSVGDGPTDNLARNESLDNNDIGNDINGTNQVFAVVNYPIVPGGTQSVIADGTVLATPAGYTVNEPIGELTIVDPPAATLYVTYYYYLLPDSTWQEFVVSGLSKLNLSTGAANVETDLTTFPQGLIPALKAYACAGFCMRLSTQTGLWYNQRLQERDEQRDSIARKFMTLAQEFMKQGDAERNSYYSGAGTQLVPSFRIREMSPRPITPRR
jgi:hypothetical protein